MNRKRRVSLLIGTTIFAILTFGLIWLTADKQGRWLKTAAWTKNTERAKLLVRLGVDVNFTDGRGTALHGAAATGNIELMRFLIERGAAVDAKAKFGVTPLYEARFYHHPEAERFLLEHGANPDTSHIRVP